MAQKQQQPQQQRRERTPRKRQTIIVKETTDISYKLIDQLKHFVTEQGYILGRDKTGISQKQQRRLTQAIKRARHLAMLPFTQTV